MAAPRSRITGIVRVTEKKTLGKEGQYKFTEAKVQTDIATIETVRFPSDYTDLHDAPRAGDLIDVAVDSSGFGGRNGVEINLTAVAPFDDSYLRQLEESLTAA